MRKRMCVLICVVVMLSLMGCHNTPIARLVGVAATQDQKPTPRYEIFVDLTTSTNITSKDGNSSREPEMVVSVVKALLALHGTDPFTVEIRGITRQSNTEDYVIPYTFNGDNEGPAQTQAFLNALPDSIAQWLEDYQAKRLSGTDIYGCLHKMATVSHGLLPNQEIVGVFISDLIHEVAPDPGVAHFERPVQVYYILSNDNGRPGFLGRARAAFEQHVRDAKGQVRPVADAEVLEAYLRAPNPTAP